VDVFLFLNAGRGDQEKRSPASSQEGDLKNMP
jgi:hypothetical protein